LGLADDFPGLAPCGYCGEERDLVLLGSSYLGWYVACGNCQQEGPEVPPGEERGREKAVALWEKAQRESTNTQPKKR